MWSDSSQLSDAVVVPKGFGGVSEIVSEDSLDVLRDRLFSLPDLSAFDIESSDKRFVP